MPIPKKFFLLLVGLKISTMFILLANVKARGQLTQKLKKLGIQIQKIKRLQKDQEPRPNGKSKEQTKFEESEITTDSRSAKNSFLDDAVEQGLTLEELEQTYILRILKKMEGNRTKTANILKIGRRTLYRKLQDYGIQEKDF